MAPPQKKF